MTIRCIIATLLFCGSISANAQSPSISYLLPSAALPGTTTTVSVFGDNLKGTPKFWTSFPGDIATSPAPSGGDAPKFQITLSPDAPVGIGALRLANANGLSALSFFMVDDLRSGLESGTNTSQQTAQEISGPIAIDGKCEEITVDFYRLTIEKEQELTLEIVAQRLGFELDSVLRVVDAKGREFGYCDDAPGLGTDSRVTCHLSPGLYYVEVRDTRYRGGSKYRYRLRVGGSALGPVPYFPVRVSWFENTAKSPERFEIEPNATAALATPIDIPVLIHGQFGRPHDKDTYVFNATKGQRFVFAGRTRSIGSACDLLMRLQSPDGSTEAEANIAGANEGTITNTFSEAGKYHLVVEELNDLGGPGFFYDVQISPLSPGFELSVDTDKFEATPGGSFDVKVICSRRNYDGPITLGLIGETEGWQLADNLIPAKATNATFKITVPTKLNPAEIRNFGIIGYTKVDDAYLETRASTMPAFRKLFSTFLFPPTTFDGWIGLGVKSSPPKPEEKTPAKTSQLNLKSATGKIRRA